MFWFQAIRRVKETDANRLRVEYEKLVRGLVSGGALRGGEDWLANPVLPDDIVRETVPGGCWEESGFAWKLLLEDSL